MTVLQIYWLSQTKHTCWSRPSRWSGLERISASQQRVCTHGVCTVSSTRVCTYSHVRCVQGALLSRRRARCCARTTSRPCWGRAPATLGEGADPVALRNSWPSFPLHSPAELAAATEAAARPPVCAAGAAPQALQVLQLAPV